MATILDALQNAHYNLTSNHGLGVGIAKLQLKNAVTLLEKGYPLSQDIEELLEDYDDVDDVPYNEAQP